MKVQEFEELNVYQRARELTNRVCKLRRNQAFSPHKLNKNDADEI
jgi:hypothetical protein